MLRQGVKLASPCVAARPRGLSSPGGAHCFLVLREMSALWKRLVPRTSPHTPGFQQMCLLCRPVTMPGRIKFAFVRGWPFASICSPRTLTGTQLSSATMLLCVADGTGLSLLCFMSSSTHGVVPSRADAGRRAAFSGDSLQPAAAALLLSGLEGPAAMLQAPPVQRCSRKSRLTFGDNVSGSGNSWSGFGGTRP